MLKMIDGEYQYALASKSTGSVWPKIFNNAEDAISRKNSSLNRDNWQIVRREVIYGEWEEVREDGSI